MPPFDWEEVFEQAHESMCRVWNNPKFLTQSFYKNPRKEFKAKTKKEISEYHEAKDELSKYGIILSRKRRGCKWI